MKKTLAPWASVKVIVMVKVPLRGEACEAIRPINPFCPISPRFPPPAMLSILGQRQILGQAK